MWMRPVVRDSSWTRNPSRKILLLWYLKVLLYLATLLVVLVSTGHIDLCCVKSCVDCPPGEIRSGHLPLSLARFLLLAGSSRTKKKIVIGTGPPTTVPLNRDGKATEHYVALSTSDSFHQGGRESLRRRARTTRTCTSRKGS